VRFTIASFAGETQDVRLPMQYECPHCQTTVPQALDDDGMMVKPETLKTKLRGAAGKPKMPCPNCKKESQFSTPQYDPDAGEPVARMVSDRFEYGRNFGNKLWNASRFVLLNLAEFSPDTVADDELMIEDRWILSRLATVTKQVTDWLDEYRFDYAAKALYDFAWDEFCSFYVEMVKGRLQDDAQRPAAQRVLVHALDTLLRLLHPMMPFITEEVWQLLAKVAPERGFPAPQAATDSIMVAPWPEFDSSHKDGDIEEQFTRFQSVLGALREIRSSQNIASKKQVEFSVRCDEPTAKMLRALEPYFRRLANATAVGWGDKVEPPATNATVNLSGIEVFVDLKDLIDIEAEKSRCEKEAGRLRGLIAGKEKKLANSSFVEKAPEAVVQRERESLAELRQQLASVEASLADLRKMQH
ncbi:MAG: class I tRNA ligase family protein, partial [Planctomycetes bacterium]|nr:class I tRNA ligase family protein [Planctomycetota bacterium]